MACNMNKIANFAKEKQELVAMCVDHYTGDIADFVAENIKTDSKSIDAQIRERITKDILHGAEFNRRSFRKYKNDIYEIIEVVLDQTIPTGWANSEFFRRFVEERRLDLGDENEFYVEDNTLLTVSKFSGNHWDTIRERLDMGATFSIPTSWYEVHFYNEFERFMKGIESFIDMMDKARESFVKFIQEAAYVAFSGIGEYVPAEFTGHGALSTDAEKEALLALIEKVEVENGAKPVLVGSSAALRKLQGKIDDFWIPETAKEERFAKGVVSFYEGYEMLPLPQVFKQGTFEFELANDKILIIAGNSKPIKLVYEGDSRIKEVTDIRENMDQTYEAQIQTKAGLGVVCDKIAGEWTLA